MKSSAEIESFYTDRIATLDAQLGELQSTERWVSRSRLTGLLALVLAVAAWNGSLPPIYGWLAAFLFVAFLVLVVFHDSINRRIANRSMRRDYNRQRQAIRARDFEGIRPFRLNCDTDEFTASQKQLAEDLDLFGEESLSHLLSEVNTPQGQQLLRRLLIYPATPTEVAERQQAVAALRDDWKFREDLALHSRILRATGASPQDLVEWGTSECYLDRRPWLVWLPRLLTVLFFALIGAVFFGLVPPIWALGIYGLITFNLLFSAIFLGKIHDQFNLVTKGKQEIDHYRALFQSVWSLSPEVARFQELRQKLQTKPGEAPDFEDALSSLQRIVLAASGRQSKVMFIPWIVAQLTVHWDFHACVWLEKWQRKYGPNLGNWFEAVAELECYASLAGLAFDHPDWAFPTVVSYDANSTAPVFAAQQMGHPLLSPDQCVKNDLSVGPAGRFQLVTGSNMSGKSTLLRSTGLNIVLAQAGSVVCASQLEVSPVQIETSMRIMDSLSDGVSFFMAELKRLKQVVDAAVEAAKDSDRTLFFLLDEILQGTNSKERHLAVERILGHLLEQAATGMVSTHDIELASSPSLSPKCDTVYLRETFDTDESGKRTMSFDYRVQPGVCPTTNALKLLEMVGLPSESPE